MTNICTSVWQMIYMPNHLAMLFKMDVCTSSYQLLWLLAVGQTVQNWQFTVHPISRAFDLTHAHLAGLVFSSSFCPFSPMRGVILCHAFNCRNTSFPSLWGAERTRSICRGWKATLQQWVARWHRQVKINIFITFSLLNIFPHLSVAKIGGPCTFLTNDAAVISL